MDGHVHRLLLFFGLLSVLGLLLTISYIKRLEKLNDQLSIHLTFKLPEIVWPVEVNYTYCEQFVQKPTTEEAIEERHLLDSIAWPDPPVKDLPVEFSSNPAMSYFVIQGPPEQHIGDQLVVNVHVHNFLDLPKKHGGDFLIARLHSPKLGAGVAGQVHDHDDGTYTVLFPLLWAGEVQVEITMVHPSEAVAVLKRLQEEHPDRIFYKSLFRSGSLSETTFCNLCLPFSQKPLCNFTDPVSGEPWYCYKPEKLGCDTRINHAVGGYTKNLISEYEAHFFKRGINIKVPIPASAMGKVTVLPAKKAIVENSYNAAGYYFNYTWRPLSGAAIQQFTSSSAITHCLRGKIVYMLGDSTVRQWFEYLTAVLPDLKQLNLYTPKRVGPFMAVDSTNNILVSYRCHGPPIRFTTVLSSELHYVANEIDRIQGGPNTVVLVSVWSHFSSFPFENYIRRLRHIRKAVVRLLNRDPETLVVIRTANLQKLGRESSMFNSDWSYLQIDTVLRAMFKGLNVKMLDAWEMTLAHHLPHDLHPPQPIIKNMVDVILSYICPAGKI
ncbi:NXPE family member 3-like [Hemibagrus wyckioides]|uniref:NXPE family member 3-like n=1 Tax=Hemibagrus wyckioides TaxID=337641 RepID=UPI00266C5DA5|nr:NXPE family member 3-like [Hemibagrus wyckioides]XP_058248521.1 NXPE family member 3-like [Hemibagrus wyckioides]XP_058248522.1 NXPE family member 3-like [Hemibagrus wyckioides]